MESQVFRLALARNLSRIGQMNTEGLAVKFVRIRFGYLEVKVPLGVRPRWCDTPAGIVGASGVYLGAADCAVLTVLISHDAADNHHFRGDGHDTLLVTCRDFIVSISLFRNGDRASPLSPRNLLPLAGCFRAPSESGAWREQHFLLLE